MMEKVTISLALLAFARAGTTIPLFVPSTSASHACSPIYNPPNTKARATPAPIYEEDVSTQETEVNAVHRLGHESFYSLKNLYPNSRNFQTHNMNTGAILNIYDETVGAPSPYKPTFTLSSSLIAKTINGPVTYTTHTHSTPFEERTDTINRHTPIAQNEALKTTINYAEAPAVSHMTFTGLGTTYSW